MHIALIYMASGFSRRFRGNKLLAPLAGKPLYRHGFDQLQDAARRIEAALSCSCRLYVVSQYDEILSWCRAHGAIAVKNTAAEEGMAASVRLGVEASAAADAWAFFAADQPFLSCETIADFVKQYAQSGCGIGCAVSGCRRGSPAIFPMSIRTSCWPCRETREAGRYWRNTRMTYGRSPCRRASFVISIRETIGKRRKDS